MFHFGCGQGHMSKAEASRRNRLARQHGAAFVTVRLPDGGQRWWFEAPNKGEPFNSALRRVVEAALAN